jgi:hypothetical protein
MDMAIICKDAAEEYIKNDTNFEIIAPVVKNSDIFLMGTDKPKRIGVTQKRDYQYNLVSEYYKDAETVPLIGTALGYGLESNLVDGIVVDIMKSLSLKGEKLSTATNREYESYVLVVSKEFKQNDLYKDFKRLYNEAVYDLEDREVFKKAIENYKNVDISNKEMEEIVNWKVKFLPIKE